MPTKGKESSRSDCSLHAIACCIHVRGWVSSHRTNKSRTASPRLQLTTRALLQTLGEVIAPQLFSLSLFPYLAFLYYLTKGRKASNAPNVMVGGFYFLLVFVFATIPAGIYAKTQYGTSLSNVDWLHGTAESFLTITNLLIGAAPPIRKRIAVS